MDENVPTVDVNMYLLQIHLTLLAHSLGYSFADTVVILFCGPEANDGVGDCGSIN